MMVAATLERLNLCPCGFTLLKNTVPLGAVYIIDPSTQTPGAVICGGCGVRTPCTLVWAAGTRMGQAGYLPLDVFKLKEDNGSKTV